MATTSLPQRLPVSVKQLILELDQLNQPAVVNSHQINAEQIQELLFLAGRRSVVEELLRLLESENDG